MPLPDFLGIGAQKAGTTWLALNLGVHPQVWLPPIKELHYFDRPPEVETVVRVGEAQPAPQPKSRMRLPSKDQSAGSASRIRRFDSAPISS